jgi:predicted DNA-binding protein with PD1-like motif
MEFKRFNNVYAVRLDKGEEIIETLKNFCGYNQITLAWVSGIGAVNRVTLGLFETKPKRYVGEELTGDFEITSLSGNITAMNKEVYLHLHATVSDLQHKTYGGHLTSAVVSATAELIVVSVEGLVERKFSQEIGLNLLEFC